MDAVGNLLGFADRADIAPAGGQLASVGGSYQTSGRLGARAAEEIRGKGVEEKGADSFRHSHH